MCTAQPGAHTHAVLRVCFRAFIQFWSHLSTITRLSAVRLTSICSRWLHRFVSNRAGVTLSTRHTTLFGRCMKMMHPPLEKTLRINVFLSELLPPVVTNISATKSPEARLCAAWTPKTQTCGELVCKMFGRGRWVYTDSRALKLKVVSTPSESQFLSPPHPSSYC